MKIVYINQCIFNSAGMERVIINKANFFAERKGYDVYIITTDQKGRYPFYPVSPKVHLIDLDINFIDYAEENIFFKVYFLWKKQRLYKLKLSHILHTIKADIVVTLMFKNLDFLYKIKDGSKKIVELHFSKKMRSQYMDGVSWSKFQKWVYKIRGWQEEGLLKKYDKFVLLTYEDATLWGNKLSNICVIPNSLSFRADQKALLDNKIAISVGRLDYQKGYDRLVDIWKQVRIYFPEWQLCIYGDGEMKDRLLKQISDNHLDEYIHMYPPTKLIREKLLEASLYLMTSRFEGLPMVLLEAMACGLPAIAYSCLCGPRDVITDGVNGFLVEENNVNLFVDRIIELLDNSEKRKQMGAFAYQNIESFSEANIMRKWEDLFQTLIDEKI